MFVCDVMMQKAARWLRLFGYPVETPENEDDAYLLDFAKKHNLILLTRDEQVVERAGKRKIRAYLVKNTTNYKQVAEIMREFRLSPSNFPKRMLCTKCNGGIREAAKTEAHGNVPQRAYDAHDEFWVCTKCGQFYWQGSHWKRIENEAEKIRNELAKSAP